jgi:hypothetical protein
MFVGCNACDPQIPQPVEWNPISASTFAFGIYSIKCETAAFLAKSSYSARAAVEASYADLLSAEISSCAHATGGMVPL